MRIILRLKTVGRRCLIRKIAALISLLCLLNWCGGQDLPEITPPSPVSREFQKFLGYPISPATGTANISIPLYSLQTSGMSIPFSLQYHGSGIQVDEAPGTIGYGFSLFPGFRISRTIMGKPDDYAKTDVIRPASNYYAIGIDQYLSNIAVDQENSLRFPDTSIGHPLDGQYDIFTIHLPNLNTTFILQWINGTLEGVPIPEAPIKIKPIRVGAGTGPLYFSYFEVTDDKGNEYIFGKDHKDASTNAWGSTSEWMLEKIITPGVGDTLNFSYSNSTIPIQSGFSTEYWGIDDCLGGKSPGACDPSGNSTTIFGSPNGSSYSDLTYNTWALTSIEFPEGHVDFSYEDQGFGKMSSIDVYNLKNENVKNITFSRIPGWNLLNKVVISGEGQYGFEYNMQPFTYQKGQDFAGYYNGQNNSTLVPTVTLRVDASIPGGGGGAYMQTINGANRQPNEQMMQSHILKKIIYPTGGFTSFTYEAHKFISKGVPSFGLGLRVASSQIYDPVTEKTTNNIYKYGENESGYGNLGTGYTVNNQVSSIDENAFISDKILISCYTCVCGDESSIRRRTISSSNRYSNFSFNLPVWYPEVTVYSNGGKTVYKYDYSPSYFADYRVGIPSGSYYNEVSSSDTKNYYISSLRNLGLSGPNLTEKQIWDATGKLLQKTSYSYTGGGAGITGIIVEPVATFMGRDYGYLVSNPSSAESLALLGLDPYPFIIQNYTIVKGNDNIASITQDDYRHDKTVETVTKFNYEDPYIYNVKSKSVTTSKGGTAIENYYYPTSGSIPDLSDLSSAQQSMISTLLNHNRLTTLLEKRTFRDSVPVNSTLYGYRDWGNSIYAIEQVYVHSGTNPFESRLHYHTYDSKGHVTSVSKENDAKQIYLWGYNGQYPVAKIVGSDYATVNAVISQSQIDNAINSSMIQSASDQSLRTALSILRTDSRTKNSLTSIYTYSPLTGITSETDPGGNTIYYEYDDFGRLKDIKDNTGKIIKNYLQHYYGQ